MNDDRGPAGDHFDGRRGDWLRWMAARKPVSWTPVTGFTPPSPPPARSDRLAIIWINHPTVLIQVADHNIILPPSNSPTKPGSPRPPPPMPPVSKPERFGRRRSASASCSIDRAIIHTRDSLAVPRFSDL